jgi:ATPase subunit of ABC transporter with duplicated ATPase domains
MYTHNFGRSQWRAIAGSGRVGDLHHELEALQREMSAPDKADDMDRVLDRFGHVQEEYEHLGGYALESQAREVLHGLGFKDDQIDGDVGALSGGWKMRVALTRVLLGMPDVLLMDEPTNHLDIESIIWLEQFLKSFPGALLMTSHARDFMNRLASKIAETKEMLVDALKDFEGTMIFVSHDRMFLRGLGSRVLELGGESGTDRHPTVYPGSYVEYVQKLGHKAPGIYS